MARPKKNHTKLSRVAANLVAYREGRGWTQTQLADELGIDLSKIARTEVGILKPSVALVELMIEKLGVSADFMFRTPKILSVKDKEIIELQAAIPTLNEGQRAMVKTHLTAYRDRLTAEVTVGRVGPRPVEGPGIIDG